jgi:hypothetical protein
MSQAAMIRVRTSLGLSTLLLFATAGCANQEAARAKAVAASDRVCGEHELSAGIERETEAVREWIVGCNFTYVRVHCTDEGCMRAEPKPPCMGDMPCLVEDPITLKWELPTHASR